MSQLEGMKMRAAPIAAAPRNRPPDMAAKKPAKFKFGRSADCAAVVHSRSRRRVMKRRSRVRTMASPARHASSGRKAIDRAARCAARLVSVAKAPKWLRKRTLALGTNANSIGMNAGIAMEAIINRTARAARGGGSNQLAPNPQSVNCASSERRRLSSILPRPTAGTASGDVSVPKIHGSSCQSPRVQRCWRRAATS